MVDDCLIDGGMGILLWEDNLVLGLVLVFNLGGGVITPDQICTLQGGKIRNRDRKGKIAKSQVLSGFASCRQVNI